MMQYGEVDALNQAIDLLTPVVLNHAIDLLTSVDLPALQEGLLDTCDDDTQGGSRGHEAQSKDGECPQLNADAYVPRRRRGEGPHS